jgi:hypothetical protein
MAIACTACSGGGDDDDAIPADAGTGKDGTSNDASPEDGGGGIDAVVDAGPTDFDGLSDDFEAGALDGKWSVFHPEVATVGVESGQLVITMTSGALWFQDGEALMVHQEVTGDFAVEAAVYARSTASPGSPPNRTVHLGGLMARNGGTGPENYVFAVVGYDENDLSVETKSTRDSVSTYEGPTWPNGDAELRLCRSGAEFRLYKRTIGATTWELAKTYTRPDLPATLQVGPIAYALNQPDITVRFDGVRFSATCE